MKYYLTFSWKSFIITNIITNLKWLDDHPGGEDVLMENSGTDASEPWEDIGHSSEAREKMKQYQIGELRQEDRKNKEHFPPTSFINNVAGHPLPACPIPCLALNEARF